MVNQDARVELSGSIAGAPGKPVAICSPIELNSAVMIAATAGLIIPGISI